MSLQTLFHNAGWVAWPLGFFSILALAILLERLVTLNRLRTLEDDAFVALETAIKNKDDAGLRDPKFAAAPLARILATITVMRGATSDEIQLAADVALAVQRLRMRRYLTMLATIGSTAPFIGLFGTVLGVMEAFKALAIEGSKVAGGISEALSATALGLLVAIPSVMAYNFLLGQVQSLLLHVQGHVTRLVPYLNAPIRERVEV